MAGGHFAERNMPQTAKLPKDVAVGKTCSCNPSRGHKYPTDLDVDVKTALEGGCKGFVERKSIEMP